MTREEIEDKLDELYSQRSWMQDDLYDIEREIEVQEAELEQSKCGCDKCTCF